jgi:hypothetical protein
MIVDKLKGGGSIPSQPDPPSGLCFRLKNDKSAPGSASRLRKPNDVTARQGSTQDRAVSQPTSIAGWLGLKS